MSADSATTTDAARRLWPRWVDSVPLAMVWRYLTHSLMLGLCMLNEMRAAPHLPDTVLSLVPYNKWVHDQNYVLWVLAYMPLALWLWKLDRQRFMHFLYLGGILSLVRGLCIVLTGLGPVNGEDLNAGMTLSEAMGAWWDLVNPVGALMGDAPHVYLTKDLFFSGHTSTTFVLLLYAWGLPRLRWAALFSHVFVVTTVFMSHLHYTIDVVGAWAITYSLYVVSLRHVPLSRFRSHLENKTLAEARRDAPRSPAASAEPSP